MIFRIHFTIGEDTEDSVIIFGDTIEEVREKADVEVAKRNGVDPWSEILEL